MTSHYKRRKFVNDMLSEVILYGGLPCRRVDVYRDALARTGSMRAAERFAFLPATAKPGLVPLTWPEIEALP